MIFLVVVELFIGYSDAAKGGAKSVMNRRKKLRSRGGAGGGGNHDEDGDGEGDDTVCLGNTSTLYYQVLVVLMEPEVSITVLVVGICHYRKLKGIVVDKELEERMNWRKP